jgi:hypothetical protein
MASEPGKQEVKDQPTIRYTDKSRDWAVDNQDKVSNGESITVEVEVTGLEKVFFSGNGCRRYSFY